MSNDPIQESIEDRLRLYGLYYDRKKGEYRRLKMNVADIVGMGSLAQAYMSVVLQKPDQSRGRPETYVKHNPEEVYDTKVDLDFYAASILIDRQVDSIIESLKSLGKLSSNYARDIRYYVSMVIGSKWDLASKSEKAVALSLKEVVKPIPLGELTAAVTKVVKAYESLGATDKAAKSPDMTKKVLET